MTNFGARPSEGSSSSSRLGRAISARPIASICCSPPLSVPAICSRRSASTGNRSNTASMSRRDLGIAAREGAHAQVVHHGHALEDGAALRHLADAQRDDLVRRAARDAVALETRSLPALGRIRPEMVFSSVVLPAPFAPISVTIWPRSIDEADVVQHLDLAVARAQPADREHAS